MLKLQIHPELPGHGLKLQTADGGEGLAAGPPRWEAGGCPAGRQANTELGAVRWTQPAHARVRGRDDCERTSPTVNTQR